VDAVKAPVSAQRFHLVATLAWCLLVVPTLLWWRQSILWVAFMSLYANMVGHWSAYQAARAESNADGAG
jgi:hypothetical protein